MSKSTEIQQRYDYASVCQHTEERQCTLVPTDAADEASWVVGPPQGGHHLSGDVAFTAVTLGAVETLVVVRADVLARVVEEP